MRPRGPLAPLVLPAVAVAAVLAGAAARNVEVGGAAGGWAGPAGAEAAEALTPGHGDGKEPRGAGGHKPGSDVFCTPGILLDLHESHSLVSCVVIFAGFIILALVTGQVIHHHSMTWLPESVVLIALGGLLGAIFVEVYGKHTLEEYFGSINVIILNVLLLPPVILESGWSLRRKDFFSQLEYILVFAVGGTLISTLVVCTLLKTSGAIGTWSTAFTFASLISATDPVATLSTYSELRVEPLLNIMVFGESTINDAVAIVLFKAGNSIHEGQEMTVSSLAMQISILLVGSPLVGALVGALIYALVVASHMDSREGLCCVTVCASAWLCYGLAELLGVSGIIAALFCGIFLGAVLRPRLSVPVGDQTTSMLRMQASVADVSIFMLVGVFAVLLEWSVDWGFAMQVAVFCIVGRALAIFPLGVAVNAVKRCRGSAAGLQPDDRNMLSNSHLVMMWHAGLRGGIAMALCLEIDSVSEPMKDKLREATFMIICVFLVAFGGTTPCFLQRMGIPIGCDAPEDALIRNRYIARGTSMVYSTASAIRRGTNRLGFSLSAGAVAAQQSGVELSFASGVSLSRLEEEETQGAHGSGAGGPPAIETNEADGAAGGRAGDAAVPAP